MALAIVSTAIVSCQKEKDTRVPENQVHFILRAQMPDTKTGIMYDDTGTHGAYIPYWQKGDEIGVLFALPSADNLTPDAVFANTQDDGDAAAFEGNVTISEGTDITFYSFYPASAGAKVYGTDVKTIGLDIPANQAPVFDGSFGYSFDPNADLMIAKPATCTVVGTTGGNDVDMYFARVSGVLRVELNSASTTAFYGELVKSFKIETSSGDISGRVAVNPVTGEYDKTNNKTDSKSITATYDVSACPVYVGYPSSNNVFLGVAPVTIPAGSSLTFTIETVDATGAAAHTLVKTIASTPKDIAFKSSKPTVIRLSLADDNIFGGGGIEYTLVKDAADLTVGSEVIIAAAEADYALGTNQATNNRTAVAQAKSTDGQTITSPGASVQILTIAAGNKANTLAFSTGSGYLYAASSSNNYLRTETDLSDNSSWSVSISSAGVATILAQGSNTRNYLQYNSGNGIFACYASDVTTQKPVAIYKRSTPDTRTEVTLSFDPASPAAITLGEDFTEPTLNVDPSAAASAVTYSVTTTPTGAATINPSTGKLTITAAGTITVKAEIPNGNSSYKPASATYTLTVNPAVTVLTLPFTETFDGSDGTMGWSGSVASGTIQYDNDGWVAENPYGADGAARFGKGSGLGSATTPSIYYSGNATLTFKAGAWNGSSESTTLKVSVSSGSIYSNTALTASASSVTLVKGAWGDYTLYLKDLESPFTVKFEGNAASNSRFFLDDINIVSGIVAPAASFGATMSNTDNVPAAGGTKTINVSGNVEWTVTAPSGVTVSPDSGDGPGSITVTIPANTSTTDTPSYTVTVSTTATVDPNSYSFVINQEAQPVVTNTSTETNPYTPQEAADLAETLSGGTLDDVYVYGIISKITTTYSSTNNNISFDISADGATTGTQFRIYRASASSADDFVVGDAVEFKGVLKKYVSSTSTTYELDGSETTTVLTLINQLHKPTISPNGGSFTTSQDVEITADAGATIKYSLDGSAPSTNYTASFTISETTLVKAVATKGIFTTGVVQASFTKSSGVATGTLPATATFNGKDETYTEGWSTTGTGKGRTDCIIIGAGENITSPAFDLSGYSSVTISIKARRYGSLSGSKATIDVSIGGDSVGTVDASSTSATTQLTDITFTPTASMTAAVFEFTCTNATSAGSSHGAGINTITITGVSK
jgi:hypothetical protein